MSRELTGRVTDRDSKNQRGRAVARQSEAFTKHLTRDSHLVGRVFDPPLRDAGAGFSLNAEGGSKTRPTRAHAISMKHAVF
jgi:hypothetical protein